MSEAGKGDTVDIAGWSGEAHFEHAIRAVELLPSSPVPSSPSQGSSLFPTGFSRSWTFRRVMPAPTAAWPPTPPTSASARRPCSVWPAEVRGLTVGENQGVSGVSLERPQRPKPCLQRGAGCHSHQAGEVMKPREAVSPSGSGRHLGWNPPAGFPSCRDPVFPWAGWSI